MNRRIAWITGIAPACCLLALPAPPARSDSAIEASSAVLAELALDDAGIQLAMRLRERDLPQLRERLASSIPVTGPCPAPCLGARLVGQTAGAAGASLGQPESAEQLAAAGNADDHGVTVRHRYRWPNRRHRLGIAPRAAGVDIGLIALQEGPTISGMARLDRPVLIDLNGADLREVADARHAAAAEMGGYLGALQTARHRHPGRGDP